MTKIKKTFYLAALLSCFALCFAGYSFASIFLDYVRKGDTKNVKEEIIKSADINGVDANGRSALMLATMSGNFEIVEALLADGVIINLREEAGETALFYAVRNNKKDILQLLLDNGADTFARNNANKTAQMVAEETRRKELATILYSHELTNFDVSPTTDRVVYKDPFFESAKNGDLRGLRDEMLEKTDLNRRDQNGMNALMYAARSGRHHAVSLLIEYGLDIEARNNGGWTALMLAAVFGNSETVKVLLDRGANPNAQDDSGANAQSLAQENGHNEIVKLFQKKYAELNS